MLPHRDLEDRRMERKIRKEETGRRGPWVTRLHVKLMGPVAEVEDTFPCECGVIVDAVFSVPARLVSAVRFGLKADTLCLTKHTQRRPPRRGATPKWKM